jgi:serine/threonine protein kinase
MTTALQQYPPFEQDYQRLNLLGEGSFGKVYLGERIPAETQIQSENADCSNKSSQGSSGLAKEKAREYFALKKLKPYLRKKHHSPPVVHIEEFPEVQLMRRLDHPNLLQLRGIVQFDKGYELNHYLVMDFGI